MSKEENGGEGVSTAVSHTSDEAKHVAGDKEKEQTLPTNPTEETKKPGG